MGPGHQIHDFNADIVPFPDGLFWTARIDDDAVRVDLENHTASLDVSDLAIQDYFTVDNALADGNSIPATVSYKVRWKGLLARVRVDDAVERFNGDFVENLATIEWSASESGFSFASDPAKTSKNEFSQVGRETNGVFFGGTGD